MIYQSSLHHEKGARIYGLLSFAVNKSVVPGKRDLKGPSWVKSKQRRHYFASFSMICTKSLYARSCILWVTQNRLELTSTALIQISRYVGFDIVFSIGRGAFGTNLHICFFPLVSKFLLEIKRQKETLKIYKKASESCLNIDTSSVAY